MEQQSVWKGALAGLVAGLAASWIMNRFQSAISPDSGGEQDDPANTKAAERISESAFDHRLSEEGKETAGPAMHYAMGAFSGAVYGAAAQVIPLADAGGGTLFGSAVWLIADEIAVPGLRLSKPPTEYPAKVHLSALAAHLVYGVSTHLIMQTLLQLRYASRESAGKAAVLGVVSGLRSISGPLFLARLAAEHAHAFRDTPFRVISSPIATKALGLLAAGEVVADKLPKTPDRIAAGPLAVRAVAGGLSGAAVFASDRSDVLTGAVLGGAGAMAGAFGGYYLRRAIGQRGVPDFVTALAEDTLTAALGRAVS